MRRSEYIIDSPDSSWRCLQTVTETAERIGKLEAQAKLVDRYDHTIEVESFIEQYDDAKAVAKNHGWNEESEAVVFWVPVENDVAAGFAFLLADRAIIVPPVLLPHLDVEPNPIDE